MKSAFSKYVYALVMIVALAGCGFSPAKFDEVQQLGYAQIWQQAKRLQEGCGAHKARTRQILAEIREHAELLGAYVEYQPDEASRLMARAVQSLIEKIDPDGSAVYCEESAANLQAAAIRAMQTGGRRAR